MRPQACSLLLPLHALVKVCQNCTLSLKPSHSERQLWPKKEFSSYARVWPREVFEKFPPPEGASKKKIMAKAAGMNWRES